VQTLSLCAGTGLPGGAVDEDPEIRQGFAFAKFPTNLRKLRVRELDETLLERIINESELSRLLAVDLGRVIDFEAFVHQVDKVRKSVKICRCHGGFSLSHPVGFASLTCGGIISHP